MTHKRDPLHPLDALNAACKAYPGGIELLARDRGVSPPTMYKKLEKRCDSHGIRYDDELSDLLFTLQANGVQQWDSTLHALCQRHGGVFVRLPELDDSQRGNKLTEQMLRIVKEQGEVAAVLVESLANDGRIDASEARRFEEQHAEALAAMVSLGEMVKRLHAEARRAGRMK